MTPPPDNDARQRVTDGAFDEVRTLVNRLFAAIFLMLLVFAVAVVWLRHSEALRDGRREADNFARVLSEYLAIRLSAIDGALSRIVASSRRIGGPDGSEREWASVLRTATTGIPGVSSIVVLDADGNVAHATIPQIAGLSWSDQPVFRDIAGGHPNLLAVGLPFSIVAGDQVLVPFGRALTDPQGEFIGAAIATLVPGQLQDFYEAFDLGPSGLAWVLLSSGDVLFRAGDVFDETGAADPAALADAPLAASGFVRGPLTQGGQEYLTAWRQSQIAELVTAVSLAETDVVPGLRTEIVAALIVVAAGGMLLFFAARTINGAVLAALEAHHAGERA